MLTLLFVRVQRADPALDAAMARDVSPPVDAAMAVPGSCTAKRPKQ